MGISYRFTGLNRAEHKALKKARRVSNKPAGTCQKGKLANIVCGLPIQ